MTADMRYAVSNGPVPQSGAPGADGAETPAEVPYGATVADRAPEGPWPAANGHHPAPAPEPATYGPDGGDQPEPATYGQPELTEADHAPADESAPAEASVTTPTEAEPVEHTPVEDVAAEPAEATAVDHAPVEDATAAPTEATDGYAPAESAAAGFAPAETAVVDHAPVEDSAAAPAESAPVDHPHAGSVAVDAPAEAAAVDVAPVDHPPVQDVEAAPVEVGAVEAAPVEVAVDGAGDGPVPDEVVAAEVAGRLGAVVGEDVEADPAEFAAAAVLDVLRASGWADAAEAAELRAEAERTRELLNMVVRDHRAREASAAGTENQQLYWLVPLLRAAHGVAFGSLGAKVALRTAVQDVPPEVLAQAGLRIDYGVEPTDEDAR